MNFFKEQEAIRKRILRFRILFYIMVFLTSLTTAIFISEFQGFYFTGNYHYKSGINSQTFYPALIGTIVFILVMAMFKRWQLNAGGSAVAEMVGGKLVPSNVTEPHLKKLRNVVEEMSLAAGIIPPQIYVLPSENHINAFAAGFTTHDAAVAISQGCLDKLTRDELQGVVAHEIAHVIHGDMKLNLELLGFLHGLMGISEIGHSIMRRRRRGSSNRKSKDKSAVFGLGLYLIGLFGYFMGLILKQSISRGQEFKADAKSVQLTRNPDGIGGALKKILAVESDFVIKASKAGEISHLYFFFPSSLSGLFSTHPPTTERVKKILPHFDVSRFLTKEKASLKSFFESDEKNHFLKSFTSDLQEPSRNDGPQHTDDECIQKAKDIFKILSSSTISSDEGESFLHQIDLNIGRLKSLSAASRTQLLRDLQEIIKEDKKLVPREVLSYILYKECLGENNHSSLLPKSRFWFKEEISVVMSFLANVSSGDKGKRNLCFQIGMKKLFPDQNISFKEKHEVKTLMGSLKRLKNLMPFDKKQFLDASDALIQHDMIEGFDELLFKKLLKQILDVPSDE